MALHSNKALYSLAWVPLFKTFKSNITDNFKNVFRFPIIIKLQIDNKYMNEDFKSDTQSPPVRENVSCLNKITFSNLSYEQKSDQQTKIC